MQHWPYLSQAIREGQWCCQVNGSTFFIVIAILMQVISCAFFASGALCRKSFYTSHTKHSGMAATPLSIHYIFNFTVMLQSPNTIESQENSIISSRNLLSWYLDAREWR
jgi:hypothetical protein